MSIKESRIEQLRNYASVGALVTETANAEKVGQVGWSYNIGTESAKPSPQFAATHSTINNTISSKLNAAGIPALTKRQKAISDAVIGIGTDPDGYNRFVAGESSRPLSEGQMEIGTPGSYGGFDMGKSPLVAHEYFRRHNVETDLGLTWAINVSAVETQSAMTEALYPTITLNPSDTRIIIRTKKSTVTRGILLSLLEKDSVEDDRRDLLDAYTDASVLDDDGIKLVPYRMEDDTNAKYFIKKGLVEDTEVRLGRVPPYPTNYLSFEERQFNLFSLSAHPGITQQGYDETDEIGPGTTMGKLLISIRKKNQSVEEGQLVSLNTVNVRTAGFLTPPEGKGKELILNLRNARFSINSKTRDILNRELEVAKDLDNADLALRYELSVNANLHTAGKQAGQLNILGKTLDIIDLRSTVDGSVVGHDTGAGKTIVDNIIIEMVGFKIEATRTNDNRRTQGVQIDPVWETEAFMVRYGTPFLSKGPIGDTDDDAERLDELMTAINVRNDILALTQTLNYTEQVREVSDGIVNDFDDDYPITGLGRLWIRPYYKYTRFDLKDVTSLDSKDALANAAARLRQSLATDISNGVQISRYMVAARAYTRNSQIVPEITLVTDEVAQTLLLVNEPGETRFLGELFPYKVYTTQDSRWRRRDEETGKVVRRIQWFLRLETPENNYNVLNWGNHFWRPVTVTNINIQRTGAVAKELAVQPCNAHINHCPITGVTEVFGLEEYAINKLIFAVESVVTVGGDDDTLDGLNPDD